MLNGLIMSVILMAVTLGIIYIISRAVSAVSIKPKKTVCSIIRVSGADEPVDIYVNNFIKCQKYFDEKLIIALESTDEDTKALCEKLESVYDFIRVIPFERIKNEWEKIFES